MTELEHGLRLGRRDPQRKGEDAYKDDAAKKPSSVHLHALLSFVL
jgi:hypothetical protein